MKVSLLILSALLCQTTMAKEFNAYEDFALYKKNQQSTSKEKQYEDKITFLEAEVSKYKESLVEKSLFLEKSQEGLKVKYEQEVAFLKRELIYKTKSLLEAQRQLEKINPSEDMKNLIKLNNEMAAQMRRAEDQLAISQLKHDKGRVPASVKTK